MRNRNTNPAEAVEIVLDPPTPAPITLTTLAAELPDLTLTELVARLGPDDVFIEPQTGLRCITVATCRRVIDEQAEGARCRAKASAEAEAKMLANLPKPTRSIPDEQFQELVEAQR